MPTNLLYPVIAFGGASLIVAVKVIKDKFNPSSKFKYDKVTDLRLKRKNYNDLKYKSTNGKTTRPTSGI